jgi:hypothetical protein
MTHHYSQVRHPVRKIPTKEQLEYSVRRQAQYEADPSYIGHSAGLHPEHKPYISTGLSHSRAGRSTQTRAPVSFDAEGEYEIEEDEAYYRTQLPTSSRRYQISPEQIIQRGNQRLHVRYVDVPKRKSLQQLPAPRERYTEEVEAVPQAKRHIHPVAWFGLFLTLLILGWMGLNFFTSWYQGVQNDWTYGQQRHFEINAVVGHSDSQTNPSHFTAENNNGQIIVIELPGNNVSKAKIYQIETVPGNNGNPPVKLSFQDMNGDGKQDMIIQIGDNNAVIYLTLYNNGSQFVSKL